ncbi:TonB-linked outer membrane protein, SusC/RagA family [Reichenbachiella agariperforans]|uniref:TonB-linked outer membrane protein, SusC/RagA family n=1 Tax=Reichenbachiella agariperforans TaxID=156994 RepID=A0A1M6LSR4_REIAG|nr:TonB-dependent receptor [Reichenbachiella agariperforans]SHJ74205.1 TonB-linked outer membrane protein, SusC/RagA family [Reichenbachiella agariperforans]
MKKRLLKVIALKRAVLSIVLTQCLLMTGVMTHASSRTMSMDDITVKGKVTDADDGSGLPGVNVLIKGSATGTVTDLDGNYTITADEAGTLVFSFIGYLTQEAPISGRSTVDVSMALDVKSLEEVVVVGYGEQRRSEVTGAISSVSSKDVVSVPVATADQALQGRAAGVTVINNGSPGTSPTVTIRGLNSTSNNGPLYVIDGVISSGMGSLNPNDIESIQVLKDASTTAVYGSKGSNGVIMITTKGGQAGKVTVDINAYAGTQWTSNRYDLLDTDEYIQYATDAFGAPTRMTDPQYSAMLENDTDWQDEIFQQGAMQSYNVGVSGGGENSAFRISGGYLSQEGIIISTGMDRYNFRANSNFSIGKLKIGENVSISVSEQNPETSNGGRSVIEHAIKSAPYLPVYNENNLGGYQGPNSSIDGQDAENPVRVLEMGSISDKRMTVIGNIYAQYEIISGLNFKSQVGGEFQNFDYRLFKPSYDDDSDGATHAQNFALIGHSQGSLQTVIFTNSLNYKKTFAEKHNLELLALAEQTSTITQNLNARSNNEISDDVNQVSTTDVNLSSYTNEYIRVGYLGRINYNYDGKYLVGASIRTDASSRFGANNRWGTFPSVSAGWRVSEEPFLQGVSAISNLKLRGSWGKTGNDNIGNYLYSTNVVSNFHYGINGGDALGATASGLANPDLKWEETAMTNIGLDLGLLNNQFTLAAEYYINKSSDILMPRVLPLSSGFHNGSVTENIGQMETKGVELNLGFQDFEGDFQWSASLLFGTSKNEVLDLGENDAITGATFEGQDISRTEVGHPAFQFYGWQFDGIFQNQGEIDAHATQPNAEPGDFRIVDVDGNGEITDDDRTFIGNPFPKFTYGLNLAASYKGLDFSLFFNGVSGNEIYNTNIYDLEGMPRLFNSGTAVLDRWTGDGSSNSIPRAGGAGTNLQTSSRFVEDGSFSRLRNVTLGYDLTRLGGVGDIFTNCRVYVSAQNLLTFTKYSGLDPEVGAYSNREVNSPPGAIGSTPTNANGQPTGNFESGVDRGNYPMPKSFIAGIEITF